MTLDALIARLHAGTAVALSRWGDGEWSALLGRGGATTDGQPYTPALGAALTAVLERRPAYTLALQPFARRTLGPAIDRWLRHHRLDDLAWADADLFARASLAGQLGPFVAALQTRPVILVGPPALAGVDRILPLVSHVFVSPREAFTSLETTWTRLAERVADHPNAVVCCSAGPTANLLVDRGATAVPTATWLDVGSLWEPYLGLLTRTYHRAVADRERRRSTLPAGVAA